jgi:hypothetical protein
MIRTILISAALIPTLLGAAAGAANAETIKISLAGKTEATVKTEISKASELVCRDSAAVEYVDCVRETFHDAMTQVARVKAVRTASLTF